MAGLYQVSYGAVNLLADSIAPPQRRRDANEGLTESWVFRTYLSNTTIDGLSTDVATLIAAITKHDMALSITRNSVAVVSSTNKAVYNIRCSARKVAGKLDLEAGQEIEVTVSYTIPMTQTDTDVWSQSYAGRKAVRVRIGFSAARRRVVSISCIYTPTTSPARTAKENYDNLHATWTAAVLAKASGGGNVNDRLNSGAGTYDLLSEDVSDMNRIDAEVSVTSAFQEILEADSDSNTDEAMLVDSVWGFRRKHGGKLGKSALSYGPGASNTPVTVVASYQGHVSNSVLTGGPSSNARWMLHEVFASKIRNILTSRARTHMDLRDDEWDVMRGPVEFNATPSSRQLNATIELTFVRRSTGTYTGPGANSSPALWVEFKETITTDIDMQNRYRKILDAGEDSYDVYTPGRLVKLTINQTCITYKAEAPEPPRLTGPWKLDRQTKQHGMDHVDIVDTRTWEGSEGKFTATYSEEVHVTVFTSTYTLAIGSQQSVAGFQGSAGARFVAGNDN